MAKCLYCGHVCKRSRYKRGYAQGEPRNASPYCSKRCRKRYWYYKAGGKAMKEAAERRRIVREVVNEFRVDALVSTHYLVIS